MDINLAVEANNFELAKKLFCMTNVDVNLSRDGETTPLINATLNNNVEMVKLLLEHNADPNITNCPAILSPLWIAVCEGYRDIAELLIQAGADVNERINSYGLCYDSQSTFLHAAALERNGHMMGLLVSHGADVNARNSQGMTVLHSAVRSQCEPSVIEMLLKHGADPNAVNEMRRSVLHMAISTGNVDLVKLLMNCGVDAMASAISGKNSLHLAAEAESESLEIAEMFINMGIEVDSVDRIHLYTPLHIALRTRKEEMVRFLLEKGANVNALARSEICPLYIAVECCEPSTVELLLSKGAYMHHRTMEGYTALHCACLNESAMKIRILVENGSDINAQDNMGRTPFCLINNSYSYAARIMVKQIVKMIKLENKTADANDMESIQTDLYLQIFYDRCLEEIEKMKKQKIYNHLSFFHVLSKPETKIAKLLRNEEFATSYDEEDVERLFPIYAKDLNLKIKKALQIKESELKVENYLQTALGSHFPTSVINRIAYFTKPEDFPMSD